MDINKDCKLLLRDVYSYDIASCHYNVLKKLGYNVDSLSTEKLQRNTQIGLMMKENPRLTNIIRSITISTIDEYLLKNDLTNDDLIIRQYDGFITTHLLRNLELNIIPLELRNCYHTFLISIDRNWFLANDGNEIDIKGIPYRYPAIDKMYKRLVSVNFGNRTATFKCLQKIKDEILSSDDTSLFCIPSGDKFSVYLKQFGQIEITKSMIKIMDPDDIDKERYFNFYLRPFTEAICTELL